MRTGGVLVADDALFPAMDLPERFRAPLAQYNEAVMSHPQLRSTLLPIGDGVMLSTKV